jgi:predicted nucleic-acid-binding Zn-ribbon protein
MNQTSNVQKIIEWINSKWQGEKTCPICKNNKWNISETLVEVREFHGGSIVIGGVSQVIPLIPITCVVCGYTIFFNAVLAGLVPVLQPQQKETATAPMKTNESKPDEKGGQ